jgi:replication-associated recombination protein RarA
MFKSIFKKGMDNLRFALNLDDYIPEHIIDELRSEQEFLNKNKDLEDIDELNSYVGRIFSKSKLESKPESTYNNYKQKQISFDDVIGYDDLKELLTKCLLIKDNCNILLSGPPASSKTIFLLSIQKEVSNVCFIDAANASGPGLVDYLFEHPDTHVICIDELDKLKRGDQTALLNLLETGILSSTKVRKTRSIKMEGVKVFATSNDVDRLVGPLRSRFLEFELPGYTWETFLEITEKLLRKRYGLDEKTSTKIAEVVWSSLQTRDLRDALAIGKLAKSTEDVEFIAVTLRKYRRYDTSQW